MPKILRPNKIKIVQVVNSKPSEYIDVEKIRKEIEDAGSERKWLIEKGAIIPLRDNDFAVVDIKDKHNIHLYTKLKEQYKLVHEFN